HGDLGGGPAHDQPRIVRFAAHGIVGRAVAVAHHDGELRHHAVGHGVHEFRAILDDAAVFAARSHHKTGGVLQEHQRDLFLVAVHDETRGLVGAVAVNHAAELHFAAAAGLAALHDLALVGHDAHGPPVDAGVGADDALPVQLLVFVVFPVVDEPRDDLAHIVLFVARVGDDAVNFLHLFFGRRRFDTAETRGLGLSHLVHDTADAPDAIRVVFALVVGNAADLAMGAGATKGLVVDVL